MNCAKCGQSLGADSAFCSRCGAPTDRAGKHDTHVPGAPGEVLEGKWRLERKIGEGGMGSVFLAQDLQLDRKVAIKLLAEALVHDRDLVTRFEREARMTAGLEHPNIVPVYAVGRAGSRPFMVMKYLEGSALSAYTRKKGTLQRDDLLPLLRQVAAGLDFIHARGFVHRDIKTGNIFVGPSGEATILDFGILRPSRNAEAITRTGMVMGTPQYMSPEQALGVRDIDHRADLYALAVVIFECLTGRLPFQGDSDLAVIHKQAHQAPPDIRQTAPWLPPEVSGVMARALAKRPEDRYPAAMELCLALERAFGVHLMTGPGGVPILTSGGVSLGGKTFPSIPGMAPVPYPIPLASAPPAVTENPTFPIPLEPTPLAPGERRAQAAPAGDDRTRPSRPSGMAAAGPAAASAGREVVSVRDLEPERPAPPRRTRRRAPIVLALSTLAVAGIAGGAALVLRQAPPPEPVAQAAPDAGVALVPVATPAIAPDGGDEVAGAADAGPDERVAALEGEAGDEAAASAGADTDAGVSVAAAVDRKGSEPRISPAAALGKVNVVTTYKGGPYWALLSVDGEKRGTTPALLELPAGRHTLRVERAGFRTVTRQIKVASGGSAVVRIELAP